MKYKLQQRQNDFLRRAKITHNDKYDYTLVAYVNSYTPVNIVCRTHGSFFQRPRTHIEGSDCPQCAIARVTLSWEDVLIRSRQIHNHKYQYIQPTHINVKAEFDVICPTHGKFVQQIGRHLAGHGCVQCGKSARKLTLAQFVERAQQTHGNKYDYSSVKYDSIHTKVTIVCPSHGPFFVDPALHIQRTGCPRCRSSKLHRLVKQFLVTNNIAHEEEYRFDACRNRYPLPFDFYIKELNTVIECDGEHHHKPVNFCGDPTKAAERFEITQRHDHIKTQYAIDYNIRLLRITTSNIEHLRQLWDT